MQNRKISVASAVVRVVLGAALLVVAFTLDRPGRGYGWWDVAAALVVFPLIALLVVAGLNMWYTRRGQRPLGATALWSPGQALAILGSVGAMTALTLLPQINRAALWLFLGGSMVLAGARGYAGCEILAVPNTILRRNVALWCPIFTPTTDRSRS